MDIIFNGEITTDLSSYVIEIEVVVMMILRIVIQLVDKQDMKIFGHDIHTAITHFWGEIVIIGKIIYTMIIYGDEVEIVHLTIDDE